MLAAARARLQSSLLTATAVLLVLVGAYATGSRAAKRSAQIQQARERTTTTRKAREVKQTLDAVDDDTVRRVARRWVRGSK